MLRREALAVIERLEPPKRFKSEREANAHRLTMECVRGGAANQDLATLPSVCKCWPSSARHSRCPFSGQDLGLLQYILYSSILHQWPTTNSRPKKAFD